MNLRLACILLAFGTVGLSASASAQSAGTGVLKLPQDIEFEGDEQAAFDATIFNIRC